VNTRQQTERTAKKKKAGGAAASDASTLFQMIQVIPRRLLVPSLLQLLMP
jgi:hypothetical protein